MKVTVIDSLCSRCLPSCLLFPQEAHHKETPEQRKTKQKNLLDKMVNEWREHQTKADKKEVDLMPSRTIKPGETLGPKLLGKTLPL